MYTIVNPQAVERMWPLVADMLKTAFTPFTAEQQLAEVKRRAIAGAAVLIVGQKPNSSEIDMVLVAEDCIIDEAKVMIVHWLAGHDIMEWLCDVELLKSIARDCGYDRLQVWGRKGWEKALMPYGFRHEFTVLSVPLKVGVH